jgi:NTP pyrophosphatase (non-canonical NTP hydrolase)
VITLPQDASIEDFQHYVHELERMHGWLDVDLVHNGFLMGEEVGELFKAIRRYEELDAPDTEPDAERTESRRQEVAEELVDVFNYLLAIANRLDIDLEEAFRRKNERNQNRTWR